MVTGLSKPPAAEPAALALVARLISALTRLVVSPATVATADVADRVSWNSSSKPMYWLEGNKSTAGVLIRLFVHATHLKEI